MMSKSLITIFNRLNRVYNYRVSSINKILLLELYRIHKLDWPPNTIK